MLNYKFRYKKKLFYWSQRNINKKKVIFIKNRSTSYYQLSYNPNVITSCNAKLIMNNPNTNDVFEYLLNGLVTEPLALEHFIIDCVNNL